MTSMITVDAKKQLLEIDCAVSEEMNAELLQSPKVLFRAEFNGIKVSFSGRGIKQVKRDGEKIFVMQIPDSIFWMQRRDGFRVSVPGEHTHCYTKFVMQLQKEDETGLITVPYEARFKVVDISISGFAFHNVTPAFADYMLPPREYKNAILHLHDDDDSEARIDFEIINVNKIREGRAIVAQRVGCQYKELPLGFESVIQRYVQSTELKLRNVE